RGGASCGSPAGSAKGWPSRRISRARWCGRGRRRSASTRERSPSVICTCMSRRGRGPRAARRRGGAAGGGVGGPPPPARGGRGVGGVGGGVTGRGGLRNELVGAQRAGVKAVILPADNRPDGEEVPERVRAGVTLLFVEALDEVLRAAGLPDPPRRLTPADA